MGIQCLLLWLCVSPIRSRGPSVSTIHRVDPKLGSGGPTSDAGVCEPVRRGNTESGSSGDTTPGSGLRVWDIL